MTGIPSIASTGSESSQTDRATLAVSKALQEKRREAQAMVRLIEGAGEAGKGQLVNYKA